jgi:hypothetical protein
MPGVNINGDPVVRIQFDKKTCRSCAMRSGCPGAKDAPRQLTVRTKEPHLAIQTA